MSNNFSIYEKTDSTTISTIEQIFVSAETSFILLSDENYLLSEDNFYHTCEKREVVEVYTKTAYACVKLADPSSLLASTELDEVTAIRKSEGVS